MFQRQHIKCFCKCFCEVFIILKINSETEYEPIVIWFFFCQVPSRQRAQSTEKRKREYFWDCTRMDKIVWCWKPQLKFIGHPLSWMISAILKSHWSKLAILLFIHIFENMVYTECLCMISTFASTQNIDLLSKLTAPGQVRRKSFAD